MPWKPSEPGERPTLGWTLLDWIVENLAAPDRIDYEPFEPTREQADFLLRFYELDPITGKRLVRRGVLSRPRGWGKSPFLAALACTEALADVVPDGWDAAGQPVGKPWSLIRTPRVQLAAVSEEQTKNSWAPLLEMIRNGPVIDNYLGLEPLDTFVNLPKGRIETITSAARTVKGNTPVFSIMDQTEEWTKSNGGRRLADVMLSNATKLGGSVIESPNAYIPGMESVAETTAVAYSMMVAGKTRMAEGLLYDHREAPPDTDMTVKESLMAGLAYAYGDSAATAGGWVDLDFIAARIWDPDMDAQLARADFLNQITHATDSWLSAPEWNACLDRDKVVLPTDAVVLGFDGSRKRSRGNTDATALMGCRVTDGHLFEIKVWEQPKNTTDWAIPIVEVDATVRDAFKHYRVVGFYADPSMWTDHVATWEADFQRVLKIKKTAVHPIEWWMNSERNNVLATEQFHSAVIDGSMTHDGSAITTSHMLNARRRTSKAGIQIHKEHPDSPRKIDAAVASILAWQARLDALSKGIGKTRSDRSIIVFD